MMNVRVCHVVSFAGRLALAHLLATGCVLAQSEVIGFDSERWVLRNAEIIEQGGRTCLAGLAYLQDVDFENGVIEVDVWVDGQTSYPGIAFRMQSEENCESVYLRPHRADRYPDAVQYTPVFNGVGSWQLYSGPGFTAGASLPPEQWIHLRLEVHGRQARLYLDDAERPALEIDQLRHDVDRGTVGLTGPRNRTACFADFRYRHADDLDLGPVPLDDDPPGMLREWQLSGVFKASELDADHPPDEALLSQTEWRTVRAEASGLVDIARNLGRRPGGPDSVLARTTIHADRATTGKYRFGYSDAVGIFLNGALLFRGNSAYRLRDPSFLGIVGPYDAVYLPLKQGENELLLVVTESFGGWGFLFQDAGATYRHETIRKAWETDEVFLIPETVVHDEVRNQLYVSNFDGYNFSTTEGGQSLARVAVTGEILERDWVPGLFNPTGMALHGDRLFVVERRAIAEIDPDTGEIVNRHMIPGAGFLNDIAIDAAGTIYVSDSRRHAIFRVTGEETGVWLEGGEVEQPNGLHVQGNRLLVGNNGDRRVKAVALATGEIETVARLGPGIIDGIETDAAGHVLVSQVEGRLFRISPSGGVTKLLDTMAPGGYSANFAYVAGQGLIVIPTFVDNRLVAYHLTPQGGS